MQVTMTMEEYEELKRQNESMSETIQGFVDFLVGAGLTTKQANEFLQLRAKACIASVTPAESKGKLDTLEIQATFETRRMFEVKETNTTC